MRFADYARASWADFLFVSLAAAALAYTLLDGFNVSPVFQHGPWCAVGVAGCEVLLFLAARSRKTAAIGGAFYGLALIASWAVATALTPGGNVFVDNADNCLIFAMVVTLTATGCFLLSRRQLGAALLFVLGSFLCALIQFFYHGSYVGWMLLFVGASLALLVYRNYQKSLTSVSTVRSVSFAPGFAVALASAMVVVGAGCGIWFGLIAPLHPEAANVKLVTEYRAYETRAVRGVSNQYQTPDTSLTSSETNEGMRTTDDIKEDAGGMAWPASKLPDTGEQPQQNQGSFLGIDFNAFEEEFDLENSPSISAFLWAVLALVLLLVLAYFVGRRLWRRARLNRLRIQGANGELEGIFLFLMGRFERLGITVPSGQSLAEFSRSSEAVIAPFGRAAGADFALLVDDYAASKYGAQPVTGEGLLRAEAFYRSFWKGARRCLGAPRYLIASFRL